MITLVSSKKLGVYKIMRNTVYSYMCSNLWLLEVESRDFSQAEKERKNCLQSCANSQNVNHFHIKRQPGTILSFCDITTLEKSRESTPNSQELEDM